MTNNKEYQLIRDLPKTKPEGKLEWFFKIIISVMAIGYFIYWVIDRNLPWDVVTIILVITIVVFWGLFLAVKLKNNKPINYVKIQDGKLYITTNNATLWCKPIHEIVEIAVVEPKIKWKIVLKSKALVFKTENDTYSLDLQYLKFDGYSTDDVFNQLKRVCKLDA